MEERPLKRRRYGGKLKHDEQDFLNASGLGKLWLVEQCINSGIDIHFNDDEAVSRASKYNRTSVCQFLLENGAYVPTDALSYACSVGGKGILELFRDNGEQFTENHLLTLIQGGHSLCCKLLLEEGVPVSDTNFMLAIRLGHPTIIELLLKYGADPNCYNGEPLIYVCARDKASLLKKLIKYEVDVDMRFFNALRISSSNNFSSVTKLLILAGADLKGLENVSLIEPTLTMVKNLRKSTRWKRLRQAIKPITENFKWEPLCKCGCKELKKLQDQATLLGIDVTDKSKRQLCFELSQITSEDFIIDPSLFDLSGSLLIDLPKWQIVDINGVLFNVFDLFSLVQKGHVTCPFTKRPLPFDKIAVLEQKYRLMMTKKAFRNQNLLLDVSSTLVPSKESNLKQTLVNDVWARLYYPPSIDIILNATDEDISDMLDKLLEISTRLEDEDIFSMVDTETIYLIDCAWDFEKKKAFVNLLVKIISVNDESTGTRLEFIAMLLQHFSTTTNLNREQDMLNFILGSPEYITYNFEMYYSSDELPLLLLPSSPPAYSPQSPTDAE